MLPRHNCPAHGEVRENADIDIDTENEAFDASDLGVGAASSVLSDGSAGDEDSASEMSFEDSDVEDIVSYRRSVNAYAQQPTPMDGNLSNKPRALPPIRFSAHWWKENSKAAQWKDAELFYPCNHEGSCDQARCQCYLANTLCERSCKCSESCVRRYPGCSCAQTAKNSKAKLCGTDRCSCYRLSRECDPDLCGSCGSREILDPTNRHDDDVGKERCRNVAIQRGIPKKTFTGKSQLHGLGLFAGETIAKDDFIGEYSGEVTSSTESERRGVLYMHKNTNYEFEVNKSKIPYQSRF